MESNSSLGDRIMRVTAKTDLPFSVDNNDAISSPPQYDCEYDEETGEEVEVEEISEQDLLHFLDEEQDPLSVIRRLFRVQNGEIPPMKYFAQERALELLTKGWTILDGIVPLDIIANGKEETLKLVREGHLKPASDLKKGDTDDPYRDGNARDDLTIWMHPGQIPSHSLSKLVNFLAMDLHTEILSLIHLNSETEYQLAYYPSTGARYDRHRDAFPIDNPADVDQRRVTAIMYLNLDWKISDGGQLRLFGRAGAQDIDVEPLAGRIVVFLSGVMDHAVLAAQKERIALTAWYR